MKKNILVLLLILLGIMIIPLPTYADISDGLMAYYPFDGNSNDFSGNGNHGTEFGGLTYKMGLSGESANFDGIDDYIRIASHSSLNPIDQLTVSFWIKVDGYTNTWSPIVHKGGPLLSGWSNREYSIWLHNASLIHLSSAGDGSSEVAYSAGSSGQGWTHYTATIDRRNQRVKIYVDGVLKVDSSDPYSSFNTNNYDLLIGWSEEPNSTHSPFMGRLDELRIHNRILSESEVVSLYEELSLNASLVARWSFNEVVGTTAFDSVGNINGTLVGGVEFYESGVLGGCIDITDGYIDMGNNLASSSTFSVQAWIKTDPGDTSPMTPVAKHWRGWGNGYYLSVNDVYDGWTYQNLAGFRSLDSMNHPTATGGPVVNDGLWHQLVGVYDNGTASLYVDGRFIASSPNGYSDSGVSLLIGGLGNYDGTPMNYFHGFIDEVSIYDSALSEAEIKILYNDGNGVNILAMFFGETLKISQEHEFSIEKDTQKNLSVPLLNPSDEQQSCTIEILNPHSDLIVSVTQQDKITLSSGDVFDIPIFINANSTPVKVYHDILLKVTVENGETLYSNIKLTIIEPGTLEVPDLSINAGDIKLTDYTLGDTATLQAVVKNQGITAASDVTVQFYELGTFLGEATLTEVAAEGTGTATITIPIGTSEGDHLIQVVVDPSNSVPELDETNNEASKIVTWGTPSTNVGNILVTGSSPSTVYAGDLFTVSGKAVYDIYVDGTRYTNYVVKGGSVQITIKDNAGNEWIYGGIHTDTNGNFNKYLQAPSTLGNYQMSMTVTDKTFTGTRELVFQVVEKPTTPQEPPVPPTVTGTGYWTYVSDTGVETWTWTWTNPPVNEPLPQTDLRVFSENIYFSNNNPAPEEDITIFAEINYWATSTDITAENVPVNLYATYPGSDKEKIGSTVISSLSVGSPDFGSRYIYGTWKNQGQGIYIIEVEIDPSFTEENTLNNAATRAVIVGDLESHQGLIQGQVKNAWGGVADAIIKLYDEAGTTLISSTLTASTGLYYFESLPIGNYQVHIVTPDGYETETDTRPAEVKDQEITVVDFYLTMVEAPVADAGGPYNGEVGDAIILGAGASYDPDGEIVLYEWDLDNDGEYEANASDEELSHTWDSEYNGTITLRVTDNNGLTATDTATVSITSSYLCGDLDHDGDVDGTDRNLLRAAFGTLEGDAGFIQEADYDEDGNIDYSDYQLWYYCYKQYVAGL